MTYVFLYYNIYTSYLNTRWHVFACFITKSRRRSLSHFDSDDIHSVSAEADGSVGFLLMNLSSVGWIKDYLTVPLRIWITFSLPQDQSHWLGTPGWSGVELHLFVVQPGSVLGARLCVDHKWFSVFLCLSLTAGFISPITSDQSHLSSSLPNQVCRSPCTSLSSSDKIRPVYQALDLSWTQSCFWTDL